MASHAHDRSTPSRGLGTCANRRHPRLLNAKYHQHPELAETLLATDDATVIHDDMNSAFWGDNAGRGRNWSGRILKLVRSELQAQRAGILGV